MFKILHIIVTYFFIINLSHAENLLDIYQKALQSDPTLNMAKLKEKVGEVKERQAIGSLLPQISFSGNISSNNRRTLGNRKSEDNYKGERYSIGLTQTVVDMPKFFNLVKHQSITEQYHSEKIVAEQQLMLEVVNRYFQVLEEKDNLILVKQEKEATEKKLVQINKQYKKSLIKITDVLDTEAELDSIKTTEIEIKMRYILAKESLSELTGASVNRLVNLKNNVIYKPIKGDINNWIEKAKANNPLLKSKTKSIDVARHSISENRSRHLPVVDLQLNYYVTNTGFQSALQDKSETKVAAINLTLPIFSGGTTYYQGKEAIYNMKISQQEYTSILRMIIKETRDAFLSTNANLRKIISSKKALKSSLKSQEAMEKGFRYGVLTISEVLNSQTRVFKSKRDLLQAKYSYIKNKIRFKNIIGEINLTSLEEINEWLVIQ